MNIGESGTGRLITALRNEAVQRAQKENRRLILIDGSPGIGCSMIASITGADGVLAVTEPTRSGMHDLERALDVAAHFHIPAWVCINKSDLYKRHAAQITDMARSRGIEVLGSIPYDPAVSRAMAQGISVLESGCTPVVEGIKVIWQRVFDALFEDSTLAKEDTGT
jgi:MinD superfamily P-loop ATPase